MNNIQFLTAPKEDEDDNITPESVRVQQFSKDNKTNYLQKIIILHNRTNIYELLFNIEFIIIIMSLFRGVS